jgi:hypothetical protein
MSFCGITTLNASDTTDNRANASGINLPAQDPSVFDFNRIMSPTAENLKESKLSAEAPFGTHIKEAIQIVKDWRKK